MSNNGRNSPQSWRPSASSNSKGIEGSDRLAGQVHGPPIHHHHHQQQQQQHHHRERLDRDRDKNHETVCNLLSMLTLGMDQQQEASTSSSGGGSGNTAALDHTRMLLLNLTNSPESCIALRRAGCIPLLIDILHPPPSPPLGMKPPEIIKTRAAKALKNIVQFNPDEKLKRKELRVLKLLEGIRAFSEAVRLALQALGKDIKSFNIGCEGNVAATETTEDPKLDDPNIQDKLRQTQQHPTANMTTLMKLSFDEEHRNIMCLLGAIHALADLIVCDHLIHGNSPSEIKDDCLLIRRYSGMTLTNLTFGDGTNKALLCGMRDFMQALVSQLDCENEDVCQVTASVLRNLSWHADSTSRASLRDSNAVPKLTLAAIKSSKESTLKATLSALWNLSAHSVSNKGAICTASPDALPFLISLLRPNNPILKTLKTPMIIIENAGGILRNVSSQICSSPELRKILRDNHCYEILLEHLKSCSLTVVSNACGTLWNLSGGVGCEEDQRKLLDLNAVPMLKNLIYSKHERISQGASAALRNLLSSRFAKEHMLQLDSRLTAQIYSPNTAHTTDRGTCVDSNQESPGSDGDFDFEFNGNVHQPHSQYQQQQQQQQPQIVHHRPSVHQEPPLAHQQSSAAAASIFHRIHVQPAHTVTAPPHFHPQSNFAHPGNYMNRPTSINYSIEPEPLDLTLTSAKSSPIHIISAAEFGGMTGHHQHLHHSHPHHRKPKPSPFSHNNTQTQCHNNPKPFYNPPSLLHQTGSASQCNSPMRFAYPGAKFNQSCPEILSRLNSGHPQINNFVPEQKPLDFSSNSPSASSSLRGAGEAAGTHNDSANGGDTTFNYSLQYTEEDDEYRVANAGNGESAAKSEDTLKTYCYEGTPHNFSISNSCQDLVQEIEFEKNNPATASASEKPSANNANKSPKLQPIDEAPKSYYVENTPAVFSRTSSLSSINSSGGLNAGENKAEPLGADCQSPQTSIDKKTGCVDESPSSAFHQAQNKRRNNTSQGILAPGRVTFSAEETPLMFSRCSSVASLDSLDVGVIGSGGGKGLASHNDDDLSDFSRRASEVVSPSDLPDSPRAMTPPVRLYEQPIHGRDKVDAPEKQEGDDDLKVFSVEEKSGLNSCRSLSPLMIDGEVLPILSKRKLEPEQGYLDKRDVGSTAATADKATMRSIAVNESQLTSNGNSETKPSDGHEKKKAAFPDDEVKIFAMEGTPFYGVSNATSLSDLTMDLDNMEQKPEVEQQCKPIEESSNPQTKQSETNVATVQADHPPQNAQNSSCETNPKPEEPIYSDVQLLQKCIRIGKTVGIPKSKSEYKITNDGNMGILAIASNTSGSTSNLTSSSGGSNFKKPLVESKSQQDFDDPDLAALIMKGRNRPKEKERISSKGSKPLKKSDKEDMNSKSFSEHDAPKQSPDQKSTDSEQTNPKPEVEVIVVENRVPSEDEKSSDSCDPNPSEVSKLDNVVSMNKTELKIETQQLDPSQISTTSLGSEWNDETPTFSSPIPSMSISTAFKIVGGGDDSSCSKAPVINNQTKIQSSMNSSMLTMSVNNEWLDNVDPPSTFSNLVSSSDCILMGSPPLNPKLQGSMSDKLSRKWKALEAGNTSSIHSNLSGQRPPLDLDLENSMISVASIKSEIYELSSTASFTNDVFQSAVEDICSPVAERITADNSIGGNTYTIFPPENMNAENGKSTDIVSEGGNTVVSDDFTDAEEIEDFETAPADDHIDHIVKPEKGDVEKTDTGKPEEVDNEGNVENDEIEAHIEKATPPSNLILQPQQQQQINQQKPLMEVHPLESGTKYSTFKVSRSPMSPRSSPKQKRRDDPERYKTRTIAALHAGRSLLQSNDSNGNPLESDSRFATFRVGGPKIAKPVQNVNTNTPSVKSSQSNSPDSTPGNSPKGIRGRRKPLYSSLPPSAIVKKRVAPPVPPKPVRQASPVRPPSGGSGVYVRPTRTSELRIAANSRDNSPGRLASSRTSSSSSLNMAPTPLPRQSDQESIVSCRPKVAPKPPVRTTASVSSASNVKPFSGSTVLIKTSNSSFGFGQQKVADGSFAQNMKGYSTLPKSSKLGGDFSGMYLPGSVPDSRNAESKESIPGSEKSQGKMGKLTNLFKKMDFHRSSRESNETLQHVENKQCDILGNNGVEKKSSRLSNFFGRKKDKTQPKPFLDSNGGSNANMGPSNNASIRGPSGIWIRRDGENKAMVAPFNYVPPPGHSITSGVTQHNKDQNSVVSSNNSNANVPAENVLQASNSSAAGSAKITTV
ncbi:Adenomatous polyposis coli protein [Orchesella cincta]|uniref:Adenomatous polyposis coli protein n=1 Tax=Orchesella cincta TaxID=48709 RepID=A0A1D2NJK8_ORCCI|nr:Adenomatous polyposis coli protein [Orchesella cincta]